MCSFRLYFFVKFVLAQIFVYCLCFVYWVLAKRLDGKCMSERRSIWKMLGPFATTSRPSPIHQMLLAVLSRAACASMSTTTTTTTARDRGDRYGPITYLMSSRTLNLNSISLNQSVMSKWLVRWGHWLAIHVVLSVFLYWWLGDVLATRLWSHPTVWVNKNHLMNNTLDSGSNSICGSYFNWSKTTLCVLDKLWFDF